MLKLLFMNFYRGTGQLLLMNRELLEIDCMEDPSGAIGSLW